MPHISTVLAASVLFAAIFLNLALQASEPESDANKTANGGLSPELVEALLALNLDKEQRAPFAAELRKYSADLKTAISRISRRRNPDQPRTIKRKARSLAKAMDESMRKILREDQWAAYESYKATFTQPPKIKTDSAEANAEIKRGPTGY